jgi:site-specific DNA recombinase
MRAALYARYSTDRQRETSIDDQLRVCEVRAAAIGADVVERYADEHVSGSTPIARRTGGTGLLAGLLADRWDVLIVEGLDRLSRDSVEAEQLLRRIEHRGVRVIGVSDGYDSESATRKLHRGMRGIINEVYLDDLRHKTHRGLDGQVARGGHAGGISYGYRSVARDQVHVLEVVPVQADVVREIFERVATGDSVRAIAHDLNARGVAGPRGTWSTAAIFGSPRKGLGVLNNEIYIGRYIWNRSQWLRDPETHRRIRRDRPRSEWRVLEREDLRIVDQQAWNAVRARMNHLEASPRKGPPPRTLLGGLLRCAECDGAVIAINKDSYGCAAHKDRGVTVCSGVSASRRGIERRLLAYLRDELLSPASLSQLHAEVRRLEAAEQAPARQSADRDREKVLRAEVARLVEAIASIGVSPALTTRLRAAEAEIAELDRRRLPAVPKPAAAARLDSVAGDYRRLLADLPGTLTASPDRVQAARAAIAAALGPVHLGADEAGPWLDVGSAADRMLVAAGADVVNVVAGARTRIRLR